MKKLYISTAIAFISITFIIILYPYIIRKLAISQLDEQEQKSHEIYKTILMPLSNDIYIKLKDKFKISDINIDEGLFSISQNYFILFESGNNYNLILNLHWGIDENKYRLQMKKNDEANTKGNQYIPSASNCYQYNCKTCKKTEHSIFLECYRNNVQYKMYYYGRINDNDLIEAIKYIKYSYDAIEISIEKNTHK